MSSNELHVGASQGDRTEDWPQLYQLWVWGVYIPLVGLFTLFFGTLAIVISFFNHRWAAHCGTGWGWALCRFNFTSVKVIGRERIDPKTSYVIMANHSSLFDIPALYGYLRRQFRWVMKKELRDIPFFGFATGQMGHVYIDRSDREKAIASLQAAAPTIRDGVSILFFPEGTRSHDGELKEFKKGGFMTALTLGLPIVPVTIRGAYEAKPPGKAGARPGSIEVIVHEPVDTASYGSERRDELMAEVKRRIASAQGH